MSTNSNKVAIGYDEGTMVVKLGKEEAAGQHGHEDREVPVDAQQRCSYLQC